MISHLKVDLRRPRWAVMLAIGLLALDAHAGRPPGSRNGRDGAPAASLGRGARRQRQRPAARARSAQVHPLAARDFGQHVDRAMLRAAYPDLDDQVFNTKLQDAMRSPESLVRAFPAAFYRDAHTVRGAMPGRRGIVFGDPHWDNFSFVRLGGRTRYVYADFDDSGRGMPSLDAARYFMVLRLAGVSDSTLHNVLDHYIHSIAHPDAARTNRRRCPRRTGSRPRSGISIKRRTATNSCSATAAWD
jgi:hypothetical protein